MSLSHPIIYEIMSNHEKASTLNIELTNGMVIDIGEQNVVDSDGRLPRSWI